MTVNPNETENNDIIKSLQKELLLKKTEIDSLEIK